MAFTVEDGTGVANANSYVTTAFVDAHHSDRGRADWAGLNVGEKQRYAILASDYVDLRFGPRFRGYRRGTTQGLEWPRLDAVDDDGHLLQGVPNLLQKAVAEYALIAARQGELAPNPDLPVPNEALEDGVSTTSPTGELIRERVGPIESEYRPPSLGQMLPASIRASQSSQVSDTFLPQYPRADLWIEQLLRGSLSGTLVRG